MTIFEYLQQKYGEAGPLVVTGMEAKAFGISNPLKSGWVEKHKDQEIAPAIAKELADNLQAKGLRTGSMSRANFCLAGAAILRKIAASI